MKLHSLGNEGKLPPSLGTDSRTIICVNMGAACSTETQAPNYMAHLNHSLRITLYTTFSNLTFKEEQFEQN